MVCISDLKSQIARKMVEIEEMQQEVNVWLAYRDAGRHVHDTEIRILEQELRDLQTSYEDMSSKLPFFVLHFALFLCYPQNDWEYYLQRHRLSRRTADGKEDLII